MTGYSAGRLHWSVATYLPDLCYKVVVPRSAYFFHSTQIIVGPDAVAHLTLSPSHHALMSRDPDMLQCAVDVSWWLARHWISSVFNRLNLTACGISKRFDRHIPSPSDYGFKSVLRFPATVVYASSNHNRELWSMTLTFQHDLHRIKKNQCAKCLAVWSFRLKVIDGTHIHAHSRCSRTTKSDH